jgi:phosphoribosylformylglycinamidine (FGAM) synthase-like amidotransferase family enzyme
VFGLMPHPERAVDAASGRTDGTSLFTTIAQRLAQVAG